MYDWDRWRLMFYFGKLMLIEHFENMSRNTTWAKVHFNKSLWTGILFGLCLLVNSGCMTTHSTLNSKNVSKKKRWIGLAKGRQKDIIKIDICLHTCWCNAFWRHELLTWNIKAIHICSFRKKHNLLFCKWKDGCVIVRCFSLNREVVFNFLK